jgi:hypothetical protein
MMTERSAKFTISRKEAADFLDVSTRTLDRYIMDRKLSSRKKAGNIWLNEEEVNNLKIARFQSAHGASPSGPGRVHKHLNNAGSTTVIDGETGEVEQKQIPVEGTTASLTPMVQEQGVSHAREAVFEELYELSRREIREHNNKLEAANYRLGQLEMQLKHSVPLLQHQEQSESLREQESVINSKLKRQVESIEMLEQEVKAEKLNKNIYIGLLFGLLAIQPLLWLLLQS